MKVGRGLAAALAIWATTAVAAPAARPKLVVAIAVDQFSAALFEQYRGRFTGGLKTLQDGRRLPQRLTRATPRPRPALAIRRS